MLHSQKCSKNVLYKIRIKARSLSWSLLRAMSSKWNERVWNDTNVQCSRLTLSQIPSEFLGTSSYSGSSSGKLAFSISLGELADNVIDLASTCTPFRFRLIDCNAFIEQHQLCVYEFEGFPDVPYAPLSYPWRGLLVDDDPSSASYWEDNLGTFAVHGAEDGDPISIDVLLHVCTAALMNSRYIWLDRLCIIQTDKEDKAWQIARMYLIYASCEMCCILPGGIRRLVSLEEETSWVHRGWTLQEAVVPKRAIIIFSWILGFGGPDEPFSFGGTCPFQLFEVIPGKSAWADLRSIVQAAPMTVGIGKKSYRVTVNIFSHQVSRAALIGVLHTFGSESDDRDLRLQAVWRSALLRTSSRPVDMIFSIMSIFDVSLDPRAFDQNDRLGATIALAREILRKGGKAHWIGAAYPLDPSPYLSTFPQFPETSVEGRAYIKHADGSREPVTEVMQSRVYTDCWLTDVPVGSMDEDGYFTFEAHALPVTLVERNSMTPSLDRAVAMQSNPRIEDVTGKTLVTTQDGSIWQVHKRIPPGDAHAYVVYMGREEQYTTAAFARWMTLTPLKGLLVEEHTPGKFHKTSYLEILGEFEDVIKSYRKVTLTVGGPNLSPKGAHHL